MLLTKPILSLPFQTVTSHFEEYVNPEVQGTLKDMAKSPTLADSSF